MRKFVTHIICTLSRYGWAKEGTQGAVGMPLNVQLIGRPWDEELVLRSMMELEEGLGMAGAKY